MSIAEKLIKITENEAQAKELNQKLEDCLYGADVGGKSWYDELWDDIQDYGNRTNYTSGFRDWMSTTITPKYLIRTVGLYEMFSNCNKLETLPELKCANENGVFNSCYTAFQMCLKLKTIDIDVMNGNTSSSAWSSAFRYCQELVHIKKLGVLESQVFNKTFEYCHKLESMIVEGTIGQNGFDIHWSTKLSADSLKSIINALSTTTTGLTITLPKTAEANYEAVYGAGSWETLTASRNNWTIAYA